MSSSPRKFLHAPTQSHPPQEQPFFLIIWVFLFVCFFACFNHRLVLPFLESYMNGVTVYTLLCLASFSQPNAFEIYHIAVFIHHLFLFYRYYSITWIYHNIFIHSPFALFLIWRYWEQSHCESFWTCISVDICFPFLLA